MSSAGSRPLRSSSLSRDSVSPPYCRCGSLGLVALVLFSLLTSPPLGASELLEHTPYVTDGASVRLIFANGDTKQQPLLLAPIFLYSSYLGGNGADEGNAIALDANGNIYIAGHTASTDFLGRATAPSGGGDLFVAKFDPAGTSLLYLTIIGSADTDAVKDLQVDATGNAFVSAWTSSENFPTQNALWSSPPVFNENGVLFKLDNNGGLVYSTYLPLDMFEAQHNLAVDAAGQAFVTGSAFVEEDGTFYSSQMILLQLSADGSQLLLDLHIGGEAVEKGTAIALDAAGTIYLTGTTGDGGLFPTTANAHQPVCGDVFYDPNTYCYRDGIVVVLDPSGQVIYSSYHGGSFSDDPQAIATDGNGHILIAGNTTSEQFPIVNALQDSCPGGCRSPRGFVSMLQFVGGSATLTYSTYLGSTEEDRTNVVQGATMDSVGNSYVTGYTNGEHFPVANPLQPLAQDFCEPLVSVRLCFDAFVVSLAPSGTLNFGTYLGGIFDEIPYDLVVRGNSLYLTGLTRSPDFPTTSTALQPADPFGEDAFLVTLGEAGAPPPPQSSMRD